MTAERLCSGGYLERICFTSFGYFSSRLIGQYLRAQCQRKPEWQPGPLQDVLLRSSAVQINYRRRACANGHDAVWHYRPLREKLLIHRAATQQHNKLMRSAQGSLPSIT